MCSGPQSKRGCDAYNEPYLTQPTRILDSIRVFGAGPNQDQLSSPLIKLRSMVREIFQFDCRPIYRVLSLPLTRGFSATLPPPFFLCILHPDQDLCSSTCLSGHHRRGKGANGQRSSPTSGRRGGTGGDESIGGFLETRARLETGEYSCATGRQGENAVFLLTMSLCPMQACRSLRSGIFR